MPDIRLQGQANCKVTECQVELGTFIRDRLPQRTPIDMSEVRSTFIMKTKSWRDHFQLDARVMATRVWHLGMIFALLLVMMVHLQYFIANWSGNTTILSCFSAGWGAGSDQSLQTNLGGRPEVQYKWGWEAPEVTELREDERFGEEAFGEISRKFVPVGISSYLFIVFGAYRTGPNSFGVAGLGSMTLYELSSPVFECSWVPSPSPTSKSKTSSEATMSDDEVIRGTAVNGTATPYVDADLYYPWRQEYVAVMVHCKFDSQVGTDREGGELKMVAKHDESVLNTGLKGVEFVAMVEPPGVYNESVFDPPFQYEYLYCGPPIRGSISPHRAREWIAYHMKLFGESSHFIFYDAGGMDDVLWRVWEPWVKLGRVSIMNVKQQARYNAYLANQIVLADDCVLRAKSLAKWTFFFDMDEYLHLTDGDNLESRFHELMSQMWRRGRRATSIELEQRPMSPKHCVKNDSDPTLHERQWAIEKLVYRRYVNTSFDPAWNHWMDVKSIHQAKYVLGRDVHRARHVEVPEGMEIRETVTRMNCDICEYPPSCEDCRVSGFKDKLHYYHYHGTTAREPNEARVCKVVLDPSTESVDYDESTYNVDNTMALLTDSVREFEFRMIGEVKI